MTGRYASLNVAAPTRIKSSWTGCGATVAILTILAKQLSGGASFLLVWDRHPASKALLPHCPSSFSALRSQGSQCLRQNTKPMPNLTHISQEPMPLSRGFQEKTRSNNGTEKHFRYKRLQLYFTLCLPSHPPAPAHFADVGQRNLASQFPLKAGRRRQARQKG